MEKHRGVSFDKRNNKWIAFIKVDGRHKTIGRYIKFEDAVKARLEAEKIYGDRVNTKKKFDLTGQQFGDLKVLYEDESKKLSTRYWIAECVCGRVKSYSQSSLTKGITKSCGCSKRKRDIIGKTFGYLKVLEDTNETIGNGATLYLCKCICGTIKKYTSTQLINKKVKSCGCKRELHVQQEFEEYRVDGVFVPLLTQKIRADNKSGVKGVHFTNRGYWIAEIKVKGMPRLRKQFKEKEDAIAQRKEWEELYHKPYIEKLEDKENGN